MNHLRAIAVLISLALLASASFAGDAVSNLPASFQGKFDFRVSEEAVLQANLRLPDGTGPFPLIVIMHGGAGLSELDVQDAADFASRGYATAVVDSFSGRGFKPDSGTGAGVSLRPTVRVADAYAALNVLVTHPQIDRQRAVLFGRSHGGATTMIAATAWAAAKYSAGGATYKGFLALYPVCSVTYPEFDRLAAPLRLHLGAKDELTPAKPCEAIVAKMQSRGQNAKSTVYENAHHAFVSDGPISYFGRWINYGSCNLQLPSVDTALPTEELKRCVQRGAWMGGNPKAAALFRQNAAQELTELFQ